MQQEELTILNIYAPNTGAPRYIRQVLNDLQRDLDSHTIIVEDFSTPLSILGTSTRQKINKDIQDLKSDLEPATSAKSQDTKSMCKNHKHSHTPITDLKRAKSRMKYCSQLLQRE